MLNYKIYHLNHCYKGIPIKVAEYEHIEHTSAHAHIKNKSTCGTILIEN